MTGLALSSFWMSGRDKRPLDFFTTGAELGFDCFELSGIRHDTFYNEIRPGDFRIVSLHDPPPPAHGEAQVGSKELKRADIVYTSLDEERRRQAIILTKHSIDVAAEYGAQAVVLHLGQTSGVSDVERQLKQLLIEDRIASADADSLRVRLQSERAFRHDEHMDALHRSLDELVKYASTRNVRLGIENRPAHEIAGFDEIGKVLAWFPNDATAIGYWHDTGHAQVYAELGFTPHVDWFKAYSSRIVGMHLHDAVGVDNHQAPGHGNIDWVGLAPLAPANAIRVMEVDTTVSVDELKTGVAHLRATGWLERRDYIGVS